jgi:hypothetical protein
VSTANPRSTAFAWAEYEGIPLLEAMSLPWPEDGMTLEEMEQELVLKRDFDAGRSARQEREAFDATKPHRWRDGWMQEHHQLLANDRNRVMERRAQEDAEEVEQLLKLRVPAQLST